MLTDDAIRQLSLNNLKAQPWQDQVINAHPESNVIEHSLVRVTFEMNGVGLIVGFRGNPGVDAKYEIDILTALHVITGSYDTEQGKQNWDTLKTAGKSLSDLTLTNKRIYLKSCHPIREQGITTRLKPNWQNVILSLQDIQSIRTPHNISHDIALITCQVVTDNCPHIATALALGKFMAKAMKDEYKLSSLNNDIQDILINKGSQIPIKHWAFRERNDVQKPESKFRELQVTEESAYQPQLKENECYDNTGKPLLLLIGNTYPGSNGSTGQAGNSGGPVLQIAYNSTSEHIEWMEYLVILGVYTGAEMVPCKDTSREEATQIETRVNTEADGLLNNSITPIYLFGSDDIITK
ncbi:hypothetical protein [Vibrio spartinae]|uniref:Uncharacterized protein n=1 Tax=Vibrio spartinae TaxID=1918945 RepID=A0A1N6M8I4_9VIBR|nr:hypothetical protein [Vibrio spartinae]SIO95751.1 hypothetical protein VSP9026_03503 [Vibrio spartinae]